MYEKWFWNRLFGFLNGTTGWAAGATGAPIVGLGAPMVGLGVAKGNLLKGIDKCSGAAQYVVQVS